MRVDQQAFLYTFLNIPQIESLLYYKIAELKAFYSEEAAMYEDLQNEF